MHLHSLGDLLAGLARLLGELLHLVRDDGEALAGVARAGRLDRRVQGEQVGLLGHAGDHLDDVADLGRAGPEGGDRALGPLREAGGLPAHLGGLAALRAISEIETPISCAPEAAADTARADLGCGAVGALRLGPAARGAFGEPVGDGRHTPAADVATSRAHRPMSRTVPATLATKRLKAPESWPTSSGAGVVHALGQVALAVGDLGHAVPQAQQRRGEPPSDPVGERARRGRR